ncbi:PP2C family protein-serine/threonine phosphatase [Colwellia psychrerythraea]|uniref:Protein serine/threonine phosphatase n=1 Tax=Colwellia psychrerythraea TaxID=28229 RepID=A0A099KW53_COLPS|nr:protein phosphatase 2C domain-containing protein [Colwellia psychrerythraea]KGJ94806.1 protein serine/threonine phosphatase [Colwellia psychrerythraea]
MNDVTVRRPLTWVSEGATDVGTVRPLNEDSFLCQSEIGLWTVADGMGGHDGGSVASQLIVENLSHLSKKANLDDFVNDIENTVTDANNRLLEYSRVKLNGRIIGSTFVSLLIKGNVGVCLWAGDSRLYRFRHDKLSQLSRDHSHVAELVSEGLISEEEAKTHPEANVITRAVGTSERLDIDVDVFDVRVGDLFLLCSDGLYNAVADDEIMQCLRESSLEIAVNKLIQTALDNQASDNVSVILVKGIHQNVSV